MLDFEEIRVIDANHRREATQREPLILSAPSNLLAEDMAISLAILAAGGIHRPQNMLVPAKAVRIYTNSQLSCIVKVQRHSMRELAAGEELCRVCPPAFAEL